MPIRVAIIDDHRLFRDALSDLLSAEPDIHVVAAAGDAAGALPLVGDTSPDVLLLDLALPDGSGLDLIRPIRERSPSTRVLVLSMHSEPHIAAAAADRGAHAMVAKSDSFEDLLCTLRRVAAGEAVAPEVRLTPREREVLTHIARGATDAQIAAALGLRPKTVEAHCQRLMSKLGVHTRAGLLASARRGPSS